MNWNESYNQWERQNWQQRPSQERYRNQGQEYFGQNDRFSGGGGYPQNYRQNFEGGYFEEDPRYSHPAGLRTEQDTRRRNFQEDQSYGQSREGRRTEDRRSNEFRTSNANAVYGASLNFGSMGSYGGAQGYGSSRNGYSADSWGSGHQGAPFPARHQVYGAYRDKNSFAAGENPTYDGSQRYGSQGADASHRSRYSQDAGSRRYTHQDDSRYEIYDTAESQYNHGEYGNPTGGTETYDLNLHSHQQFSPREQYGSRSRSHYSQGSGNDQQSYGSDLEYGNTAGPLSAGYRYEDIDRQQNPYYNDRTSENWGYNTDRSYGA